MREGSGVSAAAIVTGAWLSLLLLTAIGHAQAASTEGEKLTFDRSKGNCLTCHEIEGGDSPGNIGPALADMKRRFPDRNELFAIIADETRRNPRTLMPPFGRNLILTDQEINSIVDFLYTR
ncbi:MAG TPA: sulfur oxidation c-type cytochrome SoxX [Xanthobacteraceae bacterium]|jgi:sulfur-oxidizing protein SoxX